MRNRWYGRGSGWKHVGGKYRNDVDNYKERWWERFNRFWNVLLKSIEIEKINMKAQKDERRQKDHFRRSFPTWKKLLMRISRWWYQIHLRHSCNQEKLEKIVVQFQRWVFSYLCKSRKLNNKGGTKNSSDASILCHLQLKYSKENMIEVTRSNHREMGNLMQHRRWNLKCHKYSHVKLWWGVTIRKKFTRIFHQQTLRNSVSWE